MSAPKPRALSRYRQVRLTFTEEAGGRLSYRIYAKGLQHGWQESQCLISDSVTTTQPLNTTEDVIRALLAILGEQLLPESHTD